MTTKPRAVRGPQRFFTLPDGTKMPLTYTLPDPKECKMRDSRHCLHAEGMRAAGFRDPRVMPDDLAEIRAIHGKYRVVFPAKLETVLSAKQFDVGEGKGGKECFLPRPNKVVAIVRNFTPRKKRRDAGMSKDRADIVFKRKPGTKEVGRRARFLIKYVGKKGMKAHAA